MIDKNGRRSALKDRAPDGIPEHQLGALTPAQKAAIAKATPGARSAPAKKGARKAARKKGAKKAAAKRASAKKATTPVAETKE